MIKIFGLFVIGLAVIFAAVVLMVSLVLVGYYKLKYALGFGPRTRRGDTGQGHSASSDAQSGDSSRAAKGQTLVYDNKSGTYRVGD